MASQGVQTSVGLFGFLWKHKFFIILLLVLLPSAIQSIKVAVETENPTYPIFQLSGKVFLADANLYSSVQTLRENPSILIGMARPLEGAFLKLKYFWLVFFNVIWVIVGNVWLIFFQYLVIYKLVTPRNKSEPYANLKWALIIFFVYLFVTNTIVLIHDVIIGNVLVEIPQGLSTPQKYYYLFKMVLPLHGLWELGKYLLFDLFV